jgi:phosphatidylglycerophosphatase A
MSTSPAPKPARSKRQVRIPARVIFTDPWCFLGFGFGFGLARTAPGTFGTLAAFPLYALLTQLSLPAYLMSVLTLFLIGILICQRSEDHIKVSDHSGIVWDEIVGFLITMTAAPLSWPALAAGFVLFRLFDILKPWPICHLDRSLHGGLGIMLDDALAGLLAALSLHWLLPYLSS